MQLGQRQNTPVPAGLFQGKNYVSLYYEMIEDLRKEEEIRIRELEKLPFTPIRNFNIEGETLLNPRYSPDGNLIAFNRLDPHSHDVIMLADKDGLNSRVVTRRLPSDNTITWAPDSSKIYFCQAEIFRGFNIYQDLYSYDIEGNNLKRLTKGLRVKDPDLSPDGRRFAVVISESGNQNLALLELEDRTKKSQLRIEILTDLKLLRVSSPRWSPDGSGIVYIVTFNDGRSGLYLYNISNKTHKPLIEDQFTIANPAWSKDSRFIIYTSDETKVYNLFAYSLDEGRRYQITHLLGGAFHPDVSIDNKRIAFSNYNSRGFKIGVIEFDPEGWTPSPGPSIKPYWAENNLIKRVEMSNEIRVSKSRPYKAADTLAPRFWLPSLFSDHKGDVAGIFTAGRCTTGSIRKSP